MSFKKGGRTLSYHLMSWMSKTNMPAAQPPGDIPGQRAIWLTIAAVGLVVVLTTVRFGILASGIVELSGDEAHYWEWSRRLDWSYYSKPPGVAYAIRLGTLLFGHTELGVRFAAPILSGLSSLMMYLLARRMYDRQAGLVAAMLIQVIPIFSGLGIGMTPDTLLIFFWTLSLYLLYRAWTEGRALYWLLLGVAIGLGLLSKYAICFIYIPGLLLLLSTGEGRCRLRTVWPYLCLCLSLLFFAPVVVWNSRHGWVMFRHDMGHVRTAGGFVPSGTSLLGFVGGQAAAITPVLLVLMIYLVIRRRGEEPFCFWLTIPILGGFLAKAIFGKVQPNWPMVGWLAGLPCLGQFIVRDWHVLNRAQRRIMWIGLVIPVTATMLIHAPMVLLRIPWPEGLNPLNRLIGWRELGGKVSGQACGMDGPYFILSDHYMVASELAFYMDGRPYVYCVNLGRRMNQYDIWQDLDNLVGRDAIYVSSRPMPEALMGAFEHVVGDRIAIHDALGRHIKTFYIYKCQGFKGWTQGGFRRY